GGGEMLVALAALTAESHREALTGVGEIAEALAAHLVVHHGAHRQLELDAVAVGPCAIAAFAVASALRLMLGVKTKLQESILVLGGNHNDIAAAPAIAAARPAARDVLLAAESEAAVAAIAGLDENSYFIDEHLYAIRLTLTNLP